MMIPFLQIQADTLAQATAEVAKNTPLNTEVSVLEFIFKGGFFLIPIVILFVYTLYLIFERFLFINKAAKIDNHLIKDVRNSLNAGSLDMAHAAADRSGNAQGNVLKEGILTIGRPITEIESNMERAANIEIGEMEKEIRTTRFDCWDCTDLRICWYDFRSNQDFL